MRSGGAFVVKTPLQVFIPLFAGQRLLPAPPFLLPGQVGFGEPHPFYESGAVARMTTLKLRPRNREGA